MVEEFDLVKPIKKWQLNGKNIGKQGYDVQREPQQVNLQCKYHLLNTMKVVEFWLEFKTDSNKVLPAK